MTGEPSDGRDEATVETAGAMDRGRAGRVARLAEATGDGPDAVGQHFERAVDGETRR